MNSAKKLLSVLTLTACAGAVLGAEPTATTVAPGAISVGQASITYTARGGDTLMSIAQQYTDKAGNWIALGKLNRIDKDSAIPIGTTLLIPAELLADNPAKATVVAMTGSIAAKGADGSAIQLRIGATIVEGMQIETSGNSFLTIALIDQSRISLPSNTRVQVAKLRTTRYLNSPRTQILLLRGQLESRITPLDANRGRYEVRTPLSVAGVRGTHFRVGFAAGGTDRIATETLDGKVAVATIGAAGAPDGQVLGRAKGSITTANGVDVARDLLPAPQLATATGSARAEFPANSIALLALPGARTYHLQIATDPQASNLLAESRSSTTSIAIEGVPNGDYYARLSAVDRFGLEGMIGIEALTLKAGSATAAAATIAPNPPLVAASDDKSLTLRWKAPAGQWLRLQIARDSDFTYLVNARVVSSGEVRLARPPFGTYYARVQLLDADGSARASSLGQPFIVTDQWVMNDGVPVGVRQSSASSGR